ncbi:MAG: PD40 domain-containing protein [candidate division NC10 bacterium]|nr:PD40 domain-containing protein [candidate division NC10 bacterium]
MSHGVDWEVRLAHARRLLEATIQHHAEGALSPDGKMIVFTSHREGDLDLYLMNADGSKRRQVTDLKAASFAPFMHPNDQKIIFSSNLHDPSGRSFALYLVNTDGIGLERATYAETFASFPMVSPDGKRLVFASSRHACVPSEFNIFLADWAA